MAVRFRIASIGRGLVLAGLAWIVISGDMTALGAEPSSLKGASLRGLDGKRVDLAAPPNGATVLVFYSTECPISNSYSPTLSTLIDSFPAKSVKWIGICVDPDLSDSEVETHARDFSLKFPVVRDRQGAFARKIGAKMTPEAFVIDKDGTSPLSRPDRRPVRRPPGAERRSLGQRAQGRDRGGLERQRGEGASC